MNSLVTGCNQKSNRAPLMNLTDLEVEEALAGAQKKGLVMKITGGRVERWRHALYEAWRVEKVELAVLAELLLRGPQTEGELRARASRMEPIDDLDALRTVLKPLAERRLVVYLSCEGRRGTTVTHGFHEPEELERLRGAELASADEPAPVSTTATRTDSVDQAPPLDLRRLDELHVAIATLGATVADLDIKVAKLAEQVRAIREGLGMA
jgi:uncharacterized protein YceH (UPF0502 family)